MEIPFLYQVKRSVLCARAFADFDGKRCPDVIEKIRYDRRFVCFCRKVRIFEKFVFFGCCAAISC